MTHLSLSCSWFIFFYDSHTTVQPSAVSVNFVGPGNVLYASIPYGYLAKVWEALLSSSIITDEVKQGYSCHCAKVYIRLTLGKGLATGLPF